MKNGKYMTQAIDAPVFPRYLYDNLNRRYSLDFTDSNSPTFSSMVYFERICVGRINWIRHLENNTIELVDIIIFDPPVIIPPWWVRWMPFLPWKPSHFRQCGLGSAMLQYVIQQAEILNVEAITGFLTSDDIQETPYLESFYEKHGFIVDGENKTLYRQV